MAEPVLVGILVAVQAQVARSLERNKVLYVGRQLACSTNKKTVRSLVDKWNVWQKVGGTNRSVTDIVQ